MAELFYAPTGTATLKFLKDAEDIEGVDEGALAQALGEGADAQDGIYALASHEELRVYRVKAQPRFMVEEVT